MRFFNTAGPCRPEIHYTVDPLPRPEVRNLIDGEPYPYGLTAGKDRHLTSKADRASHGSLYLPGLKAGVSRGESDERC